MTDMARYMLRKGDPWLSTSEPDVRGWVVKGRDGETLGRVEDVYVDDHTRQVESVVLASGRIVPSGHIRVHQDYLTTDVSVLEDLPIVDHMERIRPVAHPRPGSFQDRFRQHFETAYGGGNFADYLPAYHFGRVRAIEPRLFGVSFERAEQDLRAFYELRFPERSYDDAREAIRFGFELGTSLRITEPRKAIEQEGTPLYSLNREQHRPSEGEPSASQALETSTSLSVSGDEHIPARPGNEDVHRQKQ